MIICFCDDDSQACKKVSVLLCKTIIGEDTVIQYESGNKLVGDMEKCGLQPDILYLDIEMPGMDGKDVLQRMGTLSPATYVVILTGYDKYAVECYSYHPYHYLLKMPRASTVKEINEEIRLELYQKEKAFLELHMKSEIVRIPISLIQYIECFGRMNVIHTDKDIYDYYGTLQSITEKLADYAFFRIHRSYLIPLRRIEGVDRKNQMVKLIGVDHKLPVRRTKMTELDNARKGLRYHDIVRLHSTARL